MSEQNSLTCATQKLSEMDGILNTVQHCWTTWSQLYIVLQIKFPKQDCFTSSSDDDGDADRQSQRSRRHNDRLAARPNNLEILEPILHEVDHARCNAAKIGAWGGVERQPRCSTSSHEPILVAP